MAKNVNAQALEMSGRKAKEKMFKDMEVVQFMLNDKPITVTVAWKFYASKCVAVLRTDWETTEGSASGYGYDRRGASLASAANRMLAVLNGEGDEDQIKLVEALSKSESGGISYQLTQIDACSHHLF